MRHHRKNVINSSQSESEDEQSSSGIDRFPLDYDDIAKSQYIPAVLKGVIRHKSKSRPRDSQKSAFREEHGAYSFDEVPGSRTP